MAIPINTRNTSQDSLKYLISDVYVLNWMSSMIHLNSDWVVTFLSQLQSQNYSANNLQFERLFSLSIPIIVASSHFASWAAFMYLLFKFYPLHSYSFVVVLCNSPQSSPFPLAPIRSKVSPEFPSQISTFCWISTHECPTSFPNSIESKLDTLSPALPRHSIHSTCNLLAASVIFCPCYQAWKSSVFWLLPPQLPHIVTQSPISQT